MKNILKAYNLLNEVDNKDIYKVAEEFEKYSRQIIDDNIIYEFTLTGMLNTDFLFSDFLNKYGLKNLTQL